VADFGSQYAAIRSATDCLAARVSAEDQMVQSCPEAGPMKWHQAHTTWFFETFVLRPHLADYKPFHEDFSRLFNSFYNSLAEQIPDGGQGASFGRPSLDQVLAFRGHVDRAMQSLLQRSLEDETVRLIILGLNHEQQHQELMLTDIKHAFFSNSLHPSYDAFPLVEDLDVSPVGLGWHEFGGGVAEIGHSPDFKAPLDFCFDNETPRHKVHLDRFKIASRDITCREYLDFMLDGAYSRAELWLSEGWDAVQPGVAGAAVLGTLRCGRDQLACIHFTGLAPAFGFVGYAGMPCELFRSRCFRTMAILPSPDGGGVGSGGYRKRGSRQSS
jgi:ergothioneine biosynthesis protein EgtB